MADHVLASLIHGIGSLLTSGATDHGRRLLSTGRDVGWLRDELRSTRLFLREMEVCSTEGSVAAEAWIDQMRDVMLDSEDAVDIFDAGQPVRGCCVLGKLRSRHDVVTRIRRIRAQLSDISRRRSEDTVGLDGDLDVLLQYILDGGLELSVISLVGVGGVGKTTLAKKVYAYPDVKKHFRRCEWIYVSNTMELRSILCEMAKGLMRILV